MNFLTDAESEVLIQVLGKARGKAGFTADEARRFLTEIVQRASFFTALNWR